MAKKALPWWVSLVLGVLAVVGWTLHWHVTINNNNVKPPSVLADQGYMSVQQCGEIKGGTTEVSLVREYGLPHGDDQSTGTSDSALTYPLKENHNRNCIISFTGEHEQVYSVELDLIDYWETNP